MKMPELDIPAKKKMLRKHIRSLKDQLPENEKANKSLLVWQQLETLECFQKAKVILMYWSMPDEVQTHDFILHWCTDKTIVLPVVDGDRLRLKLFNTPQQLIRNTHLDLYEPQGEDYPMPETIDLAIIPGIAFDRNNHRLGRGKAYYDKLLPHLTAYRIGIGFDFQLLDHIPTDQHDVLMDKIVISGKE